MKFKENMKNLVLVLLIVSSMTLTWNIWFSEELWPNGYNSFPYEENIFSSIGRKILSYFRTGGDGTVFHYNQLFYPKQIRININGKKELVLSSSEYFSSINNQVKDILEIFIEDSTVTEISEEELKKAYRAASVYIDYYDDISLQMVGAYFGKNIPGELNPIKEFKHLVFSLGNSTQEINLFLTDSTTGKNYQLTAKGDVSELAKKASSAVGDTVTAGVQSNNYPFSFESNFDKLSQETGTRLPIDPYAIISLVPANIKAVEGEILLHIGDSQTAATLSGLIEEFSINLGSARRFTDSVGAYNYVENFATLKINPGGLMEYSATNAEKGIKLDKNASGEYDLVKSVGDFVNLINSIVPGNTNTLVYHNVSEIGKDKYKFTFNYLADGVPVMIRKTLSNGEVMENSVEVVVEKNNIISYRQMFVNYRTTDQVVASVSTIEAMDGFYSVYQGAWENVEIDDFYLVYEYDGDRGIVLPKWVFNLSTGENILFHVIG